MNPDLGPGVYSGERVIISDKEHIALLLRVIDTIFEGKHFQPVSQCEIDRRWYTTNSWEGHALINRPIR